MNREEFLWDKRVYGSREFPTINLALAREGTKYYMIKQFLEPSLNDSVLDIGCGYGINLLSISQDVSRGIGIDISQKAVRLAKGIKTALKKENIFFQKGDANKLRFPSKKFTKIICFDVAEHLVEPKNLFREIVRVLKPGGKALIYTNCNGIFCWDFLKEIIRRRGVVEKLWLRDERDLHLHRFSVRQLQGYLRNMRCTSKLKFKGHFFSPVFQDIIQLLKRHKVKRGNGKIIVSNSVSLVSKIQCFISLLEMRLFGQVPGAGVFILITKN